MKLTRLVAILLTAVMLLAATACGTDPAKAQTNDISNATDPAMTLAGDEILMPECFIFERIGFEGEGYTEAQLETFLSEKHGELLEYLKNHGVTESEDAKICPTTIYTVDLRTGTADLGAAYLPVFADGTLVDAILIRADGDSISYARIGSLTWMSHMDGVLKSHPDEQYLLAQCCTSDGNYICLISSHNEVIYLTRPEDGEDLPFAVSEDIYGRLYDERLVISYDKIYAEKKPIREIVLCRPSGVLCYLSASRLLSADFSGEWLNLQDPLATEGVTALKENTRDAGRFEELCDSLHRAHLELYPETEIADDKQLAVKNGKFTWIVYYEDGTRFITQYESQTNEEKALIAYISFIFAVPA
jgi:hypothetical protein